MLICISNTVVTAVPTIQRKTKNNVNVIVQGKRS